VQASSLSPTASEVPVPTSQMEESLKNPVDALHLHPTVAIAIVIVYSYSKLIVGGTPDQGRNRKFRMPPKNEVSGYPCWIIVNC
jgi:hypothetical protein